MLFSVIKCNQICFCIFILDTILFRNTNGARLERQKYNVIRYRRQIQNSTCPTTKFRCDSGQCIEDIKLCDGNGDCDDNSDENVNVCSLENCPSGTGFMCKYGACIHLNGRCNGLRDCLDGSDEEFCPLTIRNNMNSSIVDGCQLPDNPLHGEYVVINHLSVRYNPGDIAPVFSVLSLNCNKGYLVHPSEDDSVSYCLPTKKWNPTPKICTRQALFSAGCRLPYNPSNGKYVVINHLSAGYNPGDIVPVYSLLSVNCNSGYVINPLQDDVPSYCLPTEEWNPALKTCEYMPFVSKGCRFPNNPSNGRYIVINQLTSEYNPGDTAPVNTRLSVNCNMGYQINPPNDKPSICLLTEVWRPPLPNCAGVSLESNGCRFPNNPPHGKYLINHNVSSYSSGDLVPFKAVLSVNCTIGYAVDPPESDTLSYCSFTGEWMPVPKKCARVCPSLISKGKTNVACEFKGKLLKSCSNVIENTVARLSCEPFYEERSMERYPFRTCQNGSWGSPIPQCYPICGKKRVTTERITSSNFNVVTQGHHPWTVEIYKVRFSQLKGICGGSILSERIVLSAVSCLVDKNGKLYDKNEYRIVNGNNYREYYINVTLDSRVISFTDTIHVPELYKGQTNNYVADIAVIILSRELELTAYVQPVCIDLETENDQQFNVYGTVKWTSNETARLNVLKEKSVSVISYNKCFEEAPKSFRKFLTYDKICIEYNCNDTSSYSQYGSPLVVLEESTDRYFVKGIRSISIFDLPGNAEKCKSNGTYTSVTAHINFIRELLAFNTR